VTRRRVTVDGRVQGVFFRDSARREAAQRGLAGRVRNNPDGTVEAVFEGPDDLVDEMVSWMRHGPPSARVESVQVSSEAPQGLRGFRVE
jgi:acylphosphatase